MRRGRRTARQGLLACASSTPVDEALESGRAKAFDDVTEGIVPGSGHWIMEENPGATIDLVRGFLAR